MAIILENSAQIAFMLVLLCVSAFFSGSETAFFNLSNRQIDKLGKSKKRFQRMTAIALADPNKLLTTLLFGNMAVNVCYFAITSTLSVAVARGSGNSAGIGVGVGAFFLLLLLGEMLPKSLAYQHSLVFASFAGPVCLTLGVVLGPMLRGFNFLVVRPSIRLLAGPSALSKAADKEVSAEQLKALIECSRQQGFISRHENQLFAEIIELAMLKARHVMQPRVDMVLCPVDQSGASMRKMMLEKMLTKMCVYQDDIDNVIGLIHQRDLLLNPTTKPGELVRKANFVPEQKTVESLLEFFKRSKTDTAIVVDEFGGISGLVSVEHIVEQIVGPIEMQDQAEMIEQVGPMTYKLSGALAIHDWAEMFGIAAENTRLSTMGGMITAMLGRIPKQGDSVKLKNLKFTVESVKKHRVESVILTLEQTQEAK